MLKPGGPMSLNRLRCHLIYWFSPSKSVVNGRYFCNKSTSPTTIDEKISITKREKAQSDELSTGKKPLSRSEIIEKVTKIMPPEDDYFARYAEMLKPAGVEAKDLIRIDAEWFSDEEKTKETFIEKADLFKKSITKHRMGQSEFIYAALRVMKDYGVHRDLEAYRALIDVFPKGAMVPRNIFQASLYHYWKQQCTIVRVIATMEENGVTADMDTEKLIIDTFGRNSIAWRKIARHIYWETKFINANPYPIPEDFNQLDGLELAMIALKRMCPDLTTKLKAYSSAQVEGSLDKTWIVCAQSPSQRELIYQLDPEMLLYVEGPLKVWLKHHSITYFILTADPKLVKEDAPVDPNDIARLPLNFYGKSRKEALLSNKSIHVQEDGIILALAATGTSSRDSLLSWVRILEQLNPVMKERRVVFKIQAPVTQVEPQSSNTSSNSTQNS